MLASISTHHHAKIQPNTLTSTVNSLSQTFFKILSPQAKLPSPPLFGLDAKTFNSNITRIQPKLKQTFLSFRRKDHLDLTNRNSVEAQNRHERVSLPVSHDTHH